MLEPLDYRPAARGSPWRGLAVFFCVGVVAGALYFALADFHAYVDTGLERWPKFEMPLPWRVGESTVVGAAAGALAAGGAKLIRARRAPVRLARVAPQPRADALARRDTAGE